MTFEQFQASRRDCADIGAAINDEASDGIPGFLYAGSLFIEKTAISGKYHLPIANTSKVSTDLETLERDLYAYGCSEGYFD